MTEEENNTSAVRRSGFAALSGLPNAGKSTLLNAILGQEIALVTPKPQTTRNRIVGILNRPGAQIVIVDTPGITEGQSELGRRMLRSARQAVGEADIVVRVLDASRLDPRRLKDRRDLEPTGKPTLVALNKVDVVRPKERLLPLIELCSKLDTVEAVVPISALRGDGIDRLLDEIGRLLPEGPELYPPDMVTDRPERFLAAEMIRGVVLRQTRQEVPHATAVEIMGWRESPKGCHIEANIIVERRSQRAIVVGSGGTMIKSIGQRARQDISRLLDCEVHLALRVEISERWRGNPRTLKELGYDE